MTLPAIGNKGLIEAKRIVDTTQFTRLAIIGSSIDSSGPSGVEGSTYRRWRPPVWDGGHGFTANNHIGTLSAGTGHSAFAAVAETSTRGAATTLPSPYNTWNYALNVKTMEWTMNGGDVSAPGNYHENCLARMSFPTVTAGVNEYIWAPSRGRLFSSGDIFAARLAAGGDLVFTFFTFDGPWGVVAEQLFMQITKDSSTLVAAGAAFSTYRETPAIVGHSVTFPVAQVANWPIGNQCVNLRILPGTTVNGEMVVVCGSQLSCGGESGLSILWLNRAGATPATFLNTADYSVASWNHFVAAGVTHIQLAMVSAADPSFEANLQAFIELLQTAVPGVKIIIAGHYEKAAAAEEAEMLAAYNVAERGGHLWINPRPAWPVPGVAYTSANYATSAWNATVYYYPSTPVSSGGNWYTSIKPGANQEPPNAEYWAQLTTQNSTHLGYMLMSNMGNVLYSDGTHPNVRGAETLAAVRWSLLREAAEKSPAVIGNHGRFLKLKG